MSDSAKLIKPFTSAVGSNGIAIAVITQDNHGLAWTVYQIGFALGQQAPSPQVAAHLNGQPLVASAPMQVSAFSSVVTQSPYAMESFFYGPPYIILEAGDQLTCAVTGANPGDTFTAAAYVEEITSPAMTAAAQGGRPGYIQRPGRGRWQ